MQVLFSATEEGNEKLTNMVGEDIRTAIKEGKAEDNMNGLSYEHKGDGVVAITDKKTGEVTMANQDPEEESAMELWAPDEQIEGFVHPEGDGVTPGQQEGAPDEHAEEHIEGGSIANQPEEPSVEEKAEGEEACPGCEDSEKHFSIESDNTAIQKVFSKQELIEYVFSEVIESEDTASVGDLKFEKVPEECAVVVTDTKTGHQAKVILDDDNLRVQELESKNFNEEGEEAEPEIQDSIGWFVVGLDADNHQLVESQEASEEAAAVARDRFEENGFDGVEVFEHLEDAQDYARSLLAHLGAEDEIEDEEPEIEQHQFSDGSVYATRTFSTHYTDLMYRLFSEAVACDGECPSEDVIKEALENDEETKVEGDVIIPVRDDLGVIHDTDNDEYTKVEVDDDGEVSYEAIDKDEAEELIEGEEEKTFCNPEETKFFSENEEMTSYMQRIFSDEADEKEIEEAIEEGNQIEKDGEIITPVDEKTAIIEDKENGEFTKATLEDEHIELHPISEEEADELTEDLEVEEEGHDAEEEEKTFCNPAETKFFSESEMLTSYMQRLFSDEADEEEIVDAIEAGEEKETDEVIITPVGEKVAVVEDKESGEFTKATLEGEDSEVVDVVPISEEEAEDLKDEDERVYSNVEETKFFSEYEEVNSYMQRIFSDEADEKDIVDAIESGEEVETEGEVITPVDDEVAVVEDKENGEFTKATLEGEDSDVVDLEPISEEEANKLLEGSDKEEEKTKDFSTLEKFFAEIAPMAPQEAEDGASIQEVRLLPGQSVVVVDENGQPVEQPAEEEEDAPSVEAIEDKALAAVQAIQDATAAATQAIQEAKAAPVEGQEAQLQEAQFSEQKTFSETDTDPLLSWLTGNKIG